MFASQLSVVLVELPYLDKPPSSLQAWLGVHILMFGVAYVAICGILLCTRAVLLFPSLQGSPSLSDRYVTLLFAGICGTEVAGGDLQVFTRCASSDLASPLAWSRYGVSTFEIVEGEYDCLSQMRTSSNGTQKSFAPWSNCLPRFEAL